ncbi:MAG: class II aldolase/adducin family protein, partial [Planctomycetota bacterium]|nr:class II aldolase/adducin family protein [Planctomycetota bacterium]
MGNDKQENMGVKMEWPTFEVSEKPIDVICKISRFYGSDVEFVIAGGGNTSVKVGDRLWVKGSGVALATIGEKGFVEMDRGALERILNTEAGGDREKREEKFKADVMAARVRPERGQRASVEVVLHHLMPRRYVVHTHSTVVNMFTCCEGGEGLVRELLGEGAIWVADVDPGLVLAQTIREAIKEYAKKTGKDCPRAIVMQNHGLLVCGDTAEEVKGNTDWVIGRLTEGSGVRGQGSGFGGQGSGAFGEVQRMEGARVR